uniref:Cnidarian restricted protein n=1 Tax=Clytia hemisphaerica TaxID=252671 RepID=A0A7M6DQX5_9CNID|eukprot:TCONS_00036463-protein
MKSTNSRSSTQKNILTLLVTMVIMATLVDSLPRRLIGTADNPCRTIPKNGESTCLPNNIYGMELPGFKCSYDSKLKSCILKCSKPCNDIMKLFRKLIHEKKIDKRLL